MITLLIVGVLFWLVCEIVVFKIINNQYKKELEQNRQYNTHLLPDDVKSSPYED